MKHILSLYFWCIGILFFGFSFVVLSISLFFLSKQMTFSIVRFLFKIQISLMGIKLKVIGKENLDKEKTYIIMGNHQSLFDIFVIPAAIPLCFTGIEAAYHFSLPIWGFLIRKWGVIPIERNNLKNAMASLQMAKKTFLSGLSIAVLPEGHRTITGQMAPFKKGPFHLAKDANADILPFGIKGLYEYNKKGDFLLNPREVIVQIGKPVHHKSVQNLSVGELRDKIFTQISELSQ